MVPMGEIRYSVVPPPPGGGIFFGFRAGALRRGRGGTVWAPCVRVRARAREGGVRSRAVAPTAVASTSCGAGAA